VVTSDRAKPGLRNAILDHLAAEPGLTDRELTNRMFGSAAHPSQVNRACRSLATEGAVERKLRPDGKIGNYLNSMKAAENRIARISADIALTTGLTDGLSEDEVKRHVVRWLEMAEWRVEVAWGKARGIDINAGRGDARWIIEAKGAGSLQPMRVNYFLAILGELLQRMSDPQAKYSIALPDMAQFRGLWKRLPELAKRRTGISVLFVAADGSVEEVTRDDPGGALGFPDVTDRPRSGELR
jgi:hypothetical protein